MYTFLLLLVSITPNYNVISCNVDTIEINSHFDDKCRIVFDQMIFWRTYYFDTQEHVSEWILMKNSRIENIKEQRIFEELEKLKKPNNPEKRFHYIPSFNQNHPWIPEYTSNGYVTRIYHLNALYKITAKKYKRSFSQDDVELLDQKFLPKENRTPIFINYDQYKTKIKSILIKPNESTK